MEMRIKLHRGKSSAKFLRWVAAWSVKWTIKNCGWRGVSKGEDGRGGGKRRNMEGLVGNDESFVPF